MKSFMNELISEEFEDMSYFEVACDAPLLAETFRNSLIFSDRNDKKNSERYLSFISKITRSGTHKLWLIRLLNRTFFDHSSLFKSMNFISEIYAVSGYEEVIQYVSTLFSSIFSDRQLSTTVTILFF